MPSLSDIALVPPKFNGRPLPIISLFKGEVSLTRLCNFRWWLLLHCTALSQDTSVFHPRINHSRDPRCPLCLHPLEDVYHFVCSCPALQSVRDIWLPTFDLASASDLLLHVLSQKWLPDSEFQRRVTLFLFDLRAKRQLLLLPATQPGVGT